MLLEEVEKLSKKKLRTLINECFTLAEVPGHDRGPLYEKAGFYMRELDRRQSSRVSIRDLLLEIVVIVLIGVEIGLAIKQGIDEDKLMGKQNGILSDMQTSSSATAETLKTLVQAMGAMNSSASATAGTLRSLQSTTVAMNKDVHGQLLLLYDPSVHLIYDTGSKKFSLSNNGRANLKFYGLKYSGGNAEMFPNSFLLAPGAAYTFPVERIYQDLSSQVTKGTVLMRPLEMYIETEQNKRFTIHCTLVGIFDGDTFTIHTQVESIDSAEWSVPMK